MTRDQFRDWLQQRIDESDCQEEYGDTWREIESGDMLPAGVEMAIDHTAHYFIFKLSDGLLASGFEIGAEGESVWFFTGNDVTNNLREYSARELDAALGRGRVAVADLERLRRP
jgi:hypothetical protein